LDDEQALTSSLSATTILMGSKPKTQGGAPPSWRSLHAHGGRCIRL